MIKKHSYFRRNDLRLQGYDYSRTGFYFVTICTKNHISHLGKIIEDQMVLNCAGNITLQCWIDLPKHYPNCQLDEFIVMPNHIHGIIQISSTGEALHRPYGDYPKNYKNLLSTAIGSFKSAVTKHINKNFPGMNFSWHRSYYDHIIRNESALNKIRKYIRRNPKNWRSDQYK